MRLHFQIAKCGWHKQREDGNVTVAHEPELLYYAKHVEGAKASKMRAGFSITVPIGDAAFIGTYIVAMQH